MVLFGMGNMGRAALKELKAKGVHITAVTDNNPSLWGQIIEGEPVFEPSRAVKLYPDEQYVVTITGPSAVKQQLRDMGVTNITSAARLSRDYYLKTLPCPFESAEFYLENTARIDLLWTLLADEESKTVLDEQIQWRTTLDDRALSPHLPMSKIYFPPFIKRLNDEEIFVDCGAYDGDTIKMFKNWSSAHAAIFAFEPLIRVQEKAIVIPCAVGERGEFTKFTDRGPGSTRGGDLPVQIVALDDVFQFPGLFPTFIKMDIEGMEPEAIRGAKRILQQNKPVLAICLYHQPAHLWEIPLLINSIQPDYKLFLRRYAEECWEIIIYAVPKERLND